MVPSMYPLLDDKQWLQQQCDDKVSIAEMARRAGNCSPASVYKAFKRHGIEYVPDHAANTAARHARDRLAKWPELLDREWLIDRHDVKGMSLQQIADELFSSVRPVVFALKMHGIASHGMGHNKKKERSEKPPSLLDNPEWLREQIATKTLQTISEETGYNIAKIGYMAKKYGIQVKTKQPASKLKKNSVPQLNDPVWLQNEYIIKDRKVREIAIELGANYWAVVGSLYRYRILKNADRPMTKKDPSLPDGVMRKDGYLLVFKPDHPNCNNSGYVPQHRLICEDALGRLLTSREEVHHLNEKRDDNRLENLLVMPDFKAHRTFHNSPPAWIPRCECCSKPRPELLAGRPEWVTLEWSPEAGKESAP